MNLKIIVSYPNNANLALGNADSSFKGLGKPQWKPIQVALGKLIGF